MKKDWSVAWKGSTQPRKQRKYRHQAPLHVRHKFLAAHLNEDLRRSFGRRAVPLRKGDEVLVMRGSFKGSRGAVDRVDLANSRVYIDGVKVKKVDGSEVMRPLSPSNLLITKLVLEDKKRKAMLERTMPDKSKMPAEVKKSKPVAEKEKPGKEIKEERKEAISEKEVKEQSKAVKNEEKEVKKEKDKK